MQINYLDAVSSVLNLMKQPDSPCKNIQMHKTCYSTLFTYLFETGTPFSMETALEWLDMKRQGLSDETCSQYANALFRLEHYLLFGNIDVPFCRSDESFLCRSGMSDTFFFLVYELEDYFSVTQNPSYYHTYSVAIKEFFKTATSLGVTEPEAITIEILLEYWNSHCTRLPLNKRQNAVCAMTTLMKYLHRRGDVPACYQLVLFGENAETLSNMKIPYVGRIFHPSASLDPKVDEFMDALDEWRYLDSSKNLYRNDLMWYFIFLEFNHIDHSDQSAALWISMLPEYSDQKKANCSVLARRVHTIKMFCDMLHGEMDSNMVSPRKVSCSIPVWSKKILDGFIDARRRDGMVTSTLQMCHAAGLRFFSYLDKHGISSADKITPAIIADFHGQDSHSTPESKNAYSVKLRQLLRFMADIDLTAPTLVFAVPTSYAPHRDIVDVLSDEMVEKIYDYRKTASTPLELRDSAMVMLGLRMGIRGIDIINLRLSDFDWKNKTVSFIQQKTRTAVTLPIPTEVGNSVYLYITKGRPKSADSGNGYIFIRHQAPYVPFTVTTVCKNTLKRVLSKYGFELLPGQGFHMTRKTFATNLLRSNNKLDDISNALGHARRENAEVYLERDEKGMRMCPLEFGGVL